MTHPLKSHESEATPPKTAETRTPDAAARPLPSVPQKGNEDAPVSSSSQTADSKELERQAIGKELDKLANEVVVADEWGIFHDSKQGSGSEAPPAIYKLLEHAYKVQAAGNVQETEIAILEGRAALNHAQIHNRVWVLNNQFGLLPILFTALSALLIYVYVFQAWLGIQKMDVVHHAAFAGMIGAVLRSLYWLQFRANRGLLRPRWFTSFIVAPAVGAILGWLVSLVIRTATQVVSGKGSVDIDWKTIGLLAAFAGYKWEWALEWLERTAKSVQARIEEKAPGKSKT